MWILGLEVKRLSYYTCGLNTLGSYLAVDTR